MRRRNMKNKKTAFIVTVSLVIAIAGIILALIFAPILIEGAEILTVIGFGFLYLAAIVAVIVCFIIVVIQRYKEIESGEEEEAKKY